MPPELHEDFGEKIGGAKKDIWKDRGLYTDDLDGMNEREAEKYVKKDNVWKKPDYQAMLDEGIPLGVVFFMKKARDSLNASPQYPYRDNTPEKRLDRQKQYVETVRELQAVVEGVRTVEDVMQVCDRFFLDNGYLEKRHGYGSTPAYQGTKKGSDNPVITNKLFGLCGSTPWQSLNGIIQGRPKRSNSVLRRIRRCRAAMSFTSTMARDTPAIGTGRKAPTMSQKAIPFCRITFPHVKPHFAGRRSTPKAAAKAVSSVLSRRSSNTSPEPGRTTETARRLSVSITLIPLASAAANLATGSIRMTGRLP